MMSNQKPAQHRLRRLCECAMLIAAAAVLSILKIDLPFGGGVTIVSMLPLILLSHRHGWKWGLFSAFAYSLIQLVLGLDNVAYASSTVMAIGIILLDYVLAYSVLGLAGLFRTNYSGLLWGILLTFTLRFLCHYITGVWIWGEWMPEEFLSLPMTSPWIYSALYNGWYMLFELVLTETAALLLLRPLKKYLCACDLAG